MMEHFRAFFTRVVAPVAHLLMRLGISAAPGSRSQGGSECWKTRCRVPAATAVASMLLDPSERQVASRLETRANARPTSPPWNGGWRYVAAHASASGTSRIGSSATPSRVVGSPGPPTYVVPVAGWWTAPSSTSSWSRSASAEHHQSSPATKL